MPSLPRGIAALAVLSLAIGAAVPVTAQSDDPLGVGRKMLAEDNPGELWIEQGKSLFYQKRGAKSAPASEPAGGADDAALREN